MNPPPPPSEPSAAAAPRRGWWSRNWKWVVPTGCLTVVALFLTFMALIVAVLFGAMKSTDVYKTAIAKAKADPGVIEALGSPVEEGMFLSGSTNVTPASGDADLSIPLSGPKGKGKLFVVAHKSAGQWTYQTLVVEIAKTGERIDLKDEAEPEEEPVEQ
jgi:hypothetical protein